jgi:hypothetical protein
MGLIDDEIVVRLADGWTIRSGSSDPDYTCGEYVRICRPDGSEYLYEDNAEWRDDPVLVMGAVIMAAAGFRPLDVAPRDVRGASD